MREIIFSLDPSGSTREAYYGSRQSKPDIQLPKKYWKVAPADMPDVESALLPRVASVASRSKYVNAWQRFCQEMMISRKSNIPTSDQVLQYIKKKFDGGKNSNVMYQAWYALRRCMEALYGNSLDDVKHDIQQIIADTQLLNSGTTPKRKLGRPKKQ